MPSVFIGVPAHGGAIKNKCVVSIIDTIKVLAANSIESYFYVIDSADIVLARNSFASLFLERNETHFLAVDTDMQFSPETVMRMFRENTPLIGCIYPKRSETGFVGRVENKIEVSNGVGSVSGVGMGLCLIERSVFDALRPKVRHQKKNATTGKMIFGFFDPIQDGSAILAEDLSFCRRWREAGGTVRALFNEDIGHIGEFTYRRSYLDHLKATASPAEH